MALQQDSTITFVNDVTDRNKRIVQVIEEACQMVLELAIPEGEPIEVHIHKLAMGLRDACTKLTKVQLELNIQILEFQLKAQPSTPPEVKEQHATTVTEVITEVDSAVADCTRLFE